MTETSPETAEKKYKSMIRAVADGRRREADPGITEASGRFAVDCEADLEIARRRVRAAAEIVEADRILAELAANLPAPRPTLQTPISEYTTLGQLSAALRLATDRAVVPADEALWKQQHGAARAQRGRAIGYLRATADPEIDRKQRDAREYVAAVRRDQAKRAGLIADRDELLTKINTMRVATEEEKFTALNLRREYSQLGKRIAAATEPDMAAIGKLEAEIAKTAEMQLDPAQLEFSAPSMTAGDRPRTLREINSEIRSMTM